MEHSDDIDTTDFGGARPGSVANLSDDDVVVKEETANVSDTVNVAPNVEFQPVVSEAKEKPVSPRMEKLRAYYAQLGQVREMMEQELEATLSGHVVEGEVEAKLYEFSHSWHSIADELSKYDD